MEFSAFSAETLEQLFEEFSLWDLTIQKARLRAEKGEVNIVETIVAETEVILAQLKLLLEGCMRPDEAKTTSKRAVEAIENSVAVDAMLASALNVSSGVWRPKESLNDVEYVNEIVVQSLFPPDKHIKRSQSRKTAAKKDAEDPIAVEEGGEIAIQFECEPCDVKFEKKMDLRKHKAKEHGEKPQREKKKYLCLKCGKEMLQQYGKKHEAKCTGQRVRHPEYKVINDNFFCTVEGCSLGFGFNSLYGLRKHFHDVHVQEHERYFQCEHCDKKFSFLTMKNKHVKAVHNKSYFCDFCGRGFGSKEMLVKHRRTHTGEKPFPCDQCEYKAAKKYNLDVHRATKHGLIEQKNYLCSLCNKQFTTMGRMHRHMTVAHGDGAEEKAASKKRQRGARAKPAPLPPDVQQQVDETILASVRRKTQADQFFQQQFEGPHGTIITLTPIQS